MASVTASSRPYPLCKQRLLVQTAPQTTLSVVRVMTSKSARTTLRGNQVLLPAKCNLNGFSGQTSSFRGIRCRSANKPLNRVPLSITNVKTPSSYTAISTPQGNFSAITDGSTAAALRSSSDSTESSGFRWLVQRVSQRRFALLAVAAVTIAISPAPQVLSHVPFLVYAASAGTSSSIQATAQRMAVGSMWAVVATTAVKAVVGGIAGNLISALLPFCSVLTLWASRIYATRKLTTVSGAKSGGGAGTMALGAVAGMGALAHTLGGHVLIPEFTAKDPEDEFQKPTPILSGGAEMLALKTRIRQTLQNTGLEGAKGATVADVKKLNEVLAEAMAREQEVEQELEDYKEKVLRWETARVEFQDAMDQRSRQLTNASYSLVESSEVIAELQQKLSMAEQRAMQAEGRMQAAQGRMEQLVDKVQQQRSSRAESNLWADLQVQASIEKVHLKLKRAGKLSFSEVVKNQKELSSKGKTPTPGGEEEKSGGNEDSELLFEFEDPNDNTINGLKGGVMPQTQTDSDESDSDKSVDYGSCI